MLVVVSVKLSIPLLAFSHPVPDVGDGEGRANKRAERDLLVKPRPDNAPG